MADSIFRQQVGQWLIYSANMTVTVGGFALDKIQQFNNKLQRKLLNFNGHF